MAEPKAGSGRFFEDFRVGEVLRHATARTLGDGDAALYLALYGDRSPLYASVEFARALGLPEQPLHDLLVFHVVFGKSVPDVSLNAVANLGYAELRFLAPVYAGDTLRAESEVIGLRATSAGDAGIVWVRTVGLNQRDAPVLSYVRWVLVNKRATSTETHDTPPPALAAQVSSAALVVPAALRLDRFPAGMSGGVACFEDYEPGERIDHIDGMTIEEAEHALATRLYQNPARIHFDAHLARSSRFGRRLIYGGHIISLARALAYNGIENAVCCLAINAGTHSNPTFAGDTIYAWSEVLERIDLPGRDDAGALRLRLVAVKNLRGAEEAFPLRRRDDQTGRESYHPNVVLDLDHVLLLPRRRALPR